MDWVLASDFSARIIDLRTHLRLTQPQLGARAGVSDQQVWNWEKGKQRPPVERLEAWATKEDWPIEIFTEGGRMPSAVIKKRLNPLVTAEASERLDHELDVLTSRVMDGVATSLFALIARAEQYPDHRLDTVSYLKTVARKVRDFGIDVSDMWEAIDYLERRWDTLRTPIKKLKSAPAHTTRRPKLFKTGGKGKQ